MRLLLAVVSSGSGENLLAGFDVASADSSLRPLELEVVVSIGSTLKRLGGATDAII